MQQRDDVAQLESGADGATARRVVREDVAIEARGD
jgi:hypothetical protein